MILTNHLYERVHKINSDVSKLKGKREKDRVEKSQKILDENSLKDMPSSHRTIKRAAVKLSGCYKRSCLSLSAYLAPFVNYHVTGRRLR